MQYGELAIPPVGLLDGVKLGRRPHLDCPWRPADVAQREGRILRQGNHNAEVQILRYVIEKSFDGYMWQTVERKARFITQVMRGRLDVREIEDIGGAALSYNEVTASRNPLPRSRSVTFLWITPLAGTASAAGQVIARSRIQTTRAPRHVT